MWKPCARRGMSQIKHQGYRKQAESVLQTGGQTNKTEQRPDGWHEGERIVYLWVRMDVSTVELMRDRVVGWGETKAMTDRCG